jgi:hypothetical protein
MTLRSTFNTMVLSMILAGGVSPASAQNVKVDPEQSKLLLAASSTATLQQELDKAGALGFRAVLGSTRGNGEFVLLLERDPSNKDQVQHLLIATNTTNTFQKEIDAAAAKGYRAVPQTFLNKPTGFIGNEIVVLMERTVNSPKRYKYQLLSSNQTSTLQSEWAASSALKYKAVGFLTRAEVMVLMEREEK